MNHDMRINRISARLQAGLLVTAMALMLAITGGLLGGLDVALGIFTGVVMLYWLQPGLAPKLMLRIQGGRPLSYGEAPALYRIVNTLAVKAGLPNTPRLYYLPAGLMNAFTMGHRQQALIGVSAGLLQHLNRDEVEGVLAHEIAHLKNNDTQIMGFAALLSQLIQVISLFGQLLLIVYLPLILSGHQILSLGAILVLIAAPYAGLLLQLTLSRSREYLADMEAAALLGTPYPLIAALLKIEGHHRRLLRRIFRWPLAQPTANSPWRSHPPTRERINRLSAMGNGVLPQPARQRGTLQSRSPGRPPAAAGGTLCRAYGICRP
jgi:heat shock protein HtpX